jgi:hypothetical protein
MTITENRTYPIKDKIFSIDHVRNLARLLQEEYDSSIKGLENLTSKEKSIALYFRIKCLEPVSFEHNNSEIFLKKSKIYTKHIQSIEMSFSEGDNKKIKIILQHGDEYNELTKEYINSSYTEVTGKNELWVNGLLAKLTDYIDSVPNQERGILDWNSYALSVALCILGGYLTSIVFSLNMCRNDANYFWKDLYHDNGLIWSIVAFGFISFIPGIFFAAFIENNMDKICHHTFPIVELQLGEDHFHLNKKKRAKLRYIWLMIILPIIISIATNIVSSYLT